PQRGSSGWLVLAVGAVLGAAGILVVRRRRRGPNRRARRPGRRTVFGRRTRAACAAGWPAV
ncbi:LPXTG cell wall anchor domain-containing protein, partial [Kitasatospora sp. NPDC002227]|uniref:LPXTG cell wall anchor domain-containing protein n=1 Tax=Kitasatospora sp. NPDC002227 TaxID=3154773 RepID=UPI00331D7199